MHKVQSAMKSASDLSDDALMESVVTCWKAVCDENAAQKNLVTSDQFAQWERFRDQTQGSLRQALEEYDGELTESGRKVFRGVANAIAGTTHKSADELETEKAIRKLEEIQHEARSESKQMLSQRKKRRWLGLLGGK